MPDGPGLKIPTPEYRSQSYIRENTNLRVPGREGFQTDPELYDNINIAHQSGLTNWWNTFVQGVQQTKQFINTSDLMDGMVSKANSQNELKALENQKSLGQINDIQYLTQKENILNKIQKSYNDIQEANSDIQGHQQSINDHPVPKGYQWRTNLAVLQGENSSLSDYFKYALPNVAGSSFATLAATISSGMLGKIIKTMGTRALAGTEAGPWGTIIGAGLGLAEVLGTNAYARNLESKAEIGSQFLQDYQELRTNLISSKPQGYTPTEDEENALILKASAGSNEQYWKNMSLSVSDAVQSLIFAGAFGGMFKNLTNINKFTRALGGVSELYVQSKLEGLEEGLQQAFQYEKHGKSLDLKDYMSQGHSIFRNYADVLGSMKFLGFGGKGPYSQDEQFNSSVYAGSMLGALFGGSHVAFNMAKDVHSYRATAKELAAANPTKIDEPVLKLKDDIYAQFFGPKSRGPLGVFSEDADDRVFFFKQALKTLNKKLDKEGKPLFSSEELSKELKDIDLAYSTFSKINGSLDSILAPYGKSAATKFQKQIYRNELFHNTLSLQRTLPKVAAAESSYLNSLQSEQLDSSIENLASLQAHLEVINKRLQSSFGNYETFLKAQKKEITKKFKADSKTYQDTFDKEATLPDLAPETMKALNDFYDASESKFDYIQKRADLSKVKTWSHLQKWFEGYRKNLGEQGLKEHEQSVTEDNVEFAKDVSQNRAKDFTDITDAEKLERNNVNKQTLERGGYGKSYIDTLTPEQMDLEASKVLEEMKAGTPKQTEDQVLTALSEITSQDHLKLLLSRPSFRATFNSLGLNEADPIEVTQAKAKAMALNLAAERAKNKKRTELPGKKAQTARGGRQKNSIDTREIADYKRQYEIKEGVSSQRTVLEGIIKSDFATEPEKELAKQFLAVTKDEEIKFGDLTRTENGEVIREASGRYSTVDDSVTIDLVAFGDEFAGNDKNQAFEAVVLHELVHKYTVKALAADQQLRGELQDMIAKLKEKGYSEAEYNGLKNPEEFLAEANTSPTFQAVIAQAPGTKRGTTIWENFINALAAAIKRVFDIDIRGSMLEDVINITSGLVNGKTALDSVKFNEEQIKIIDAEMATIDPKAKDADIKLNDLYGQLYTEILGAGYPEETRQGLIDYLTSKLHALEAQIKAEDDKSGIVYFKGKGYEKGSYVALKGYADPYTIVGADDVGLVVETKRGPASIKLTLPEPKPILFNGDLVETQNFLSALNNPSPEEAFTPIVLFKSTGNEFKIIGGKLSEQTEPTEARFYNFLDRLSKLNITSSPYFGLLIKDSDEYKGVPIPHTKEVQDYFARGGKRGEVVIVVDSSGTPMLFDDNGLPSAKGSIIVFNIETPKTILARNSTKLADALHITNAQADRIKQEAAEKVRTARKSAADGKPVILRFKSVSPGIGFKDIVDQLETRPMTVPESESIVRIVNHLAEYPNQVLKDFLFNYIIGKGEYKVSGGQIMYQGAVVQPTAEMIFNNFSLKKYYEAVEKNQPYNILDVQGKEVIATKSYPNYQDYLRDVTNLGTDISQSKYNRYVVYDIGEALSEEKKEDIKQTPPIQPFEDGSLFDSPLESDFYSPMTASDLGLFNNLTTYNLTKSIDKGVHAYLRQTDIKTIGEATEDPNFIANVLNITRDSIVAKLEQMKALRPNDLAKIQNKIDTIKGNWPAIVRYYLTNSIVFSYSNKIDPKFDEEGNIQTDNDELNPARDKGFDKIGNEISPIDGASSEIKALIRGLSKFRETPEGLVIALNEFNVPDLTNFVVTWNNLLKNLNGIADFSDMIDKLDVLKGTFPEYKELLDILRKYYAKAQKGDVAARKMIALFKRDLGRPELPIIENIIEVEYEKDGNGKDTKRIKGTVFKVDEATRKNTRELKRLFLDNFLKNSTYRATTSSGNVVLSSRILNAATSTKADKIAFFEGLGFKFTAETKVDPSFDTLTSSQVINLFKADIRTLFDNKILIKDPLTDLSKRTLVTQGLSRRINDLLELESKYSRVAPSLSMQNVEDNTEWGISNPNGYTVVFAAINDATKYPTFQDLIKEPQFAHLGKPYALSSHDLNQVFDLDSEVNFGKRRDIKNPVIIDLTNISGLKIEGEYGKKTTTLYIGDKIVSDFNQFLKSGYKEATRAGDKNSAFAIRTNGYNQDGKRLRLPIANMKLFEGVNGYGGELMNNIMEKYLASELARVWLGFNGHLDNIAKLGNLSREFSLFREILSKPVQDALIAKVRAIEADPENIYARVMSVASEAMSSPAMITEIKKFFYKEVEAKMASLNKYGFGFSNPYWLDDSLKPWGASTLLRAYIVNEFIVHVEQTKLVNGDVVFYSNKNGDFHKRVPKDGATGMIPITDRWWVDAANLDPNNNLQSKLLGVNNSYSNIVNTVVFKEQQSTSAYADTWKAYLKEKGIPDKEINRIVNEYTKGNIKEGDAQGWVTMDFYRNFKLSIGAWTSDQEKVYEKVSKGEALDSKESQTLHQLFPPVKAQYAGPIVHEYYHVPGFHKFSLMPLLPSVIKGSALEHLNERMIRQNVGYSLLESGSKSGTIVTKAGLESFYEDDARTMSSANKPFRTFNQIHMHFLKEQVQVEPELHTEVLFGTQFRKLLFQGVYSMGKALSPKVANLEQEYSSIINDITEFEKSRLTKELGVEPEFDSDHQLTGYKLVDETQLVEKLQDEISNRNLNINIRDFFKLVDGKLRYTIDASQSHQNIRNLIMSMINNRLVRQNIKGDLMIQGSGLGTERYEKPTEADKLEYGTNGLRFYYVKDGKVRAMQVKVPLTGDFLHLLRLDWKGEKVETIEKLNRLLKDEAFVEAHRKMITMIGYRIPTQGLNSIEMMEVAEFLPTEAANILIVPTEIVVKAGSDFDIDKLSVFKPSLRYDKDLDETTYIGKPKKKFNYQDKLNKIVEKERVIEENRELADLVNTARTRLGQQPSSQNSETYTALNASLGDSNQAVAQVRDDLEEIENYRFGLFNRILELASERLSDPDSFSKLITPNSVDLLKAIVEKLGVKTKTYKHTTNLLSSTQEDKYLAAIPNKNALGIAAVANSFSQLFAKIGLGVSKAIYHPMIKAPYSVSNHLLEGGTDKSEITSQMINAYVDVLNDDFISAANLSIDTAGPFFYLLHLGHDYEQLFYFFNNPIIKDYVAKSQRSRSLIIKNLDPTYDIKTTRRNIVASIFDPETKFNLKAMRTIGRREMNEEYFTKSHLESVLNEPLSEFSQQEKIAVLAYYLDVLDQSQDLFKLQQINNYDTSTSVNPVAHEYREYLKNGLEKSATFTGNVEDVTNKTVIKPFNQYHLISSVLNTLLPVSLNSEIRKDIINIIAELADNFELDSDPEKIARTFINDWLYYLYTNEGKLKNGENIGDYGRSLLFDETRLSKTLLDLKSDAKWARLRDEFPIINQLREDQVNNLFNISLYRDDNSTEYQNTLIEQFLTLGNFEDNSYSEDDRNTIKKFFRNLAILGFTQSGLNKSPISFTDIIPNEFYVPLMDEALKAYKALPTADQKLKLDEFTHRFRQNNPQLFGQRGGDIAYWRFKNYRTGLKLGGTSGFKVISGMQTGVDTIGLEIGEELGLLTGGTTTPGFLTEEGDNPLLAERFGVQQISPELQGGKGGREFYLPRTEQNVLNSDGTVYFASDTDSAGKKATESFATKHGKPFLLNPTGQQLADWIKANNIKTLNVAGNRGSKLTPEMEANVRNVLREALTQAKTFDSPILSSGQNDLYYNEPLQEGTYQALLATLQEQGLITPKCN